jgi:hypothetical protein
MDAKLANVNGTLNFSASLQTVDAHRVTAALEKAIERLQLLTMLNYETNMEAIVGGTVAAGASASSHSKNRSKGQSEADKGVGALLEDQKRLEARYEQLLIATKKVHSNPLDPQLDQQCFAHVENAERRAQLEELQRISIQLKEQSKLLCRQLKENPNDADNWKKIVTERSELIALLSMCVRELTSGSTTVESADVQQAAAAAATVQQVSTYEQFAKKVLDEQSAQIWADDLVKKEKEINQNVKQLQSEVKLERLNKERELEECHRKLTDLKTELRLLRRDVKERGDKLRAETEAASEAQQRKALDNQRVVRNAISSTRDAVQNETQVHEDFIAHIAERSRQLDEIAAKWDQKSQEEIKKMEGRKVDVEQTRKECADRLKEKSEQRLLALEAQKVRREEKRLEDDERHERSERALQEYEAATKLQAALKGLFTRQSLVSLKKKAGKKKK